MSRRDIDAMHERRMRAQLRFSIIKWAVGWFIVIAMFFPQVFYNIKIFVRDVVDCIKHVFDKFISLFKK